MSAKGWIGVDLDGTLAQYDKWIDELHIGEPIAPMVDRVRAWLKDGREVRIMTARVYAGDDRDISPVRKAIQDWCKQHIGEALDVTCQKDYHMDELWDDRAVRVVMNKGVPCCGKQESDQDEFKKAWSEQ